MEIEAVSAPELVVLDDCQRIFLNFQVNQVVLRTDHHHRKNENTHKMGGPCFFSMGCCVHHFDGISPQSVDQNLEVSGSKCLHNGNGWIVYIDYGTYIGQTTTHVDHINIFEN